MGWEVSTTSARLERFDARVVDEVVSGHDVGNTSLNTLEERAEGRKEEEGVSKHSRRVPGERRRRTDWR